MAVKHTEVFMVRHGQTDSNVGGLLHGATDVPLNGVGLRQAQMVASRIEQLESLHSLHSSPLQRALTTAHAISSRTGLTPLLHGGLAEMDFGQVEGLTIAAMAEQFPDLAVRFADFSDLDARFPGGESRREFHDRVRMALDRIVTSHAGERLVVVAHGGVIASLIAQMLGDDPNDWRRYTIDNCSVTHLEFATSGPIAHLLNDVVHLEQTDIDDLRDEAGA
ncbi:MAG TPA: histidine phosphatase family protein [Thermomicrobiales bacterium]|nr:histidine phosphatase family protein [Thermomicrobiales bacterium]